MVDQLTMCVWNWHAQKHLKLNTTHKLLTLWLCVQGIPNQTCPEVPFVSVSRWLWSLPRLGATILAHPWMLVLLSVIQHCICPWEWQPTAKSHYCHPLIINSEMLCISSYWLCLCLCYSELDAFLLLCNSLTSFGRGAIFVRAALDMGLIVPFLGNPSFNHSLIFLPKEKTCFNPICGHFRKMTHKCWILL